MARIRALKPEFFLNESLAALPPLARLTYAGLWCHADRCGRLEDRPARLKVAILPYDQGDMHQLLGQLAKAGFIVRYQVDGHRYIQIPTWDKHQIPHHREVDSRLPAPPTEAKSAKFSRKTREAQPRHGSAQGQPWAEHDLGRAQPELGDAQPVRSGSGSGSRSKDQEHRPDGRSQPAQPVENSKTPPTDEPPWHGSRSSRGPPEAPRWPHYLKLAHAALAEAQLGDTETDVAESVKQACARAGWPYDGRRVGQALDAARQGRAKVP